MKSQKQEVGDRRRRKAREPLRVLVIRHAIARDPTEFARTGAPDADRPLTKQGRKRMRLAARGLAALVPEVSLVASSPLTRAIETAEIVSERFARSTDEVATLRLSALAPGKPASLLLSWLDEQPRELPLVLIGHEPHLGHFVSWALTGLRESFVEMKKGAAVLLEFPDEVRPGRAKLLWSLRPGQLRAIGELTRRE